MPPAVVTTATTKSSKSQNAAATPAAPVAVAMVSKASSKPVTVSSTPPESSPVDPEQVLKATRALIKYLATKKPEPSAKPNLLSEDGESTRAHGIYGSESIWLIITTKKFVSDKKQLKPIRIGIPNPILDPTITSAVLLVKDPQRIYKDLLLPSNLTVQRVIGLSKLRSKYKTFESRRQLRDSYDLVLADDRILPSLRKVLGATFLRSTTKTPIPVNIAGKNANTPPTLSQLEKEIKKAMESAYVHLSPSNSTTIRVGLAKHTPEQIAENIEVMLGKVVGGKKVVKGGWKAVRSIYVKSGTSVALPVYLAEKLFDEEKDVITEEQREETKKALGQKKKAREERRKEKKAKKGLTGAKSLLEGSTPQKRKRKAGGEVEEAAAESKTGSPKTKRQKTEEGKQILNGVKKDTGSKPADTTEQPAPAGEEKAAKKDKEKQEKKKDKEMPVKNPGTARILVVGKLKKDKPASTGEGAAAGVPAPIKEKKEEQKQEKNPGKKAERKEKTAKTEKKEMKVKKSKRA